jgi:SHS2 domain-containing protein
VTREPFTTSEERGRVVVSARGRTGSELFAAASAAYFSTVSSLASVRARHAYDLERRADSVEELFVGWLNDLVWVFSEQEVVCAEVDFSHWAPTSYRATLLGEPIDSERHKPRDVVEAATGRGLELAATEGCWSARVILLT